MIYVPYSRSYKAMLVLKKVSKSLYVLQNILQKSVVLASLILLKFFLIFWISFYCIFILIVLKFL